MNKNTRGAKKKFLAVIIGVFFPGVLLAGGLQKEKPAIEAHFMAYGQGIKGQCLDLDKGQQTGLDFFVAIANAPQPILGDGGGTVSLWVKHVGRFNYDFMFSCGTYERPDNALSIMSYGGSSAEGNIAVNLSDADGERFILGAPKKYTLNEWTHMAFCWNEHQAALYINGEKVGSKTNLPLPRLSVHKFFYLGSYYGPGGSLSFKGQMDEVMIFNRSLSDEEISKLYCKDDFSEHAGLVFYAPFDGTDICLVKRLPCGRDFPREIEFEFPEPIARLRHFPSGTKIETKILIPANSGLTGDCQAIYRLLDINDQELLHEEKTISVNEPKNITVPFTVAPERCGLYWLEVDLKDSKGTTVKKREFPFAMIVKLPPTTSVSADSPLGMHDLTPEGPSIGIKWDRLCKNPVNWANMEREPGKIFWGNADRIIAEEREQGIECAWTFLTVPHWAADVTDAEASRYLFSLGQLKAGEDIFKTGDIHIRAWKGYWPPKNIRDWENFIRQVVARYKDRIKYWEIWNEPNGLAVFWEKPENYVRLLKSAYTTIHAEDPEAKVLGCCAYPGGIVPWTRKVLEAGGGPYMDILAVHNYNSWSPIKWATELRRIEEARELLVKYNGKAIPIWDTEMGFRLEARRPGPRPRTDDEFIKKYGAPHAPIGATQMTSEHRGACWEVWAYLFNMASGVEKTFIHHGAGFVIRDHLSGVALPTEKSVAFAAMAKVVSDRKEVKRIKTGTQDSAGMLVEHQNGKYTAVVFADKPTTLYFPAGGKKVFEGMDFLGNPLRFEAKDDLLTVPAKLEQVYIFDVDPAFEGTEILRIETDKDINPDVPRQQGTITIRNPFNEKLQGKLSAALSDGWKAEMAEDVTLDAKGAGTVSFTLIAEGDQMRRGVYEAVFRLSRNKEELASEKLKFFFYGGKPRPLYQAGKSIAVDGEIQDWSNISAEQVNTITNLVMGHPDLMFPERFPHWKGAQDLSFTVKTTWRFNDGIYLLIEVTDDRLEVPDKDKHGMFWYMWDSVEICFDGRTNKEIKDTFPKLTRGAEKVFIIPALTQTASPCRIYQKEGTDSLIDTRFVGKKTPTGYIIEGRISPRKDGMFDVVPGALLSLDVAINDADDLSETQGARKSQMVWIGTADTMDATKWGRFELQLDAKPHEAGAQGVAGISYGDWLAHKEFISKDPSLAVYYIFDEGAGGVISNRATAADTSRYDAKNRDGVWNHGRWPGKKALAFDSGYLQAEACNIKDKSFTCEMWVKNLGPGTMLPERKNGTLIGTAGYWSGWRITITEDAVCFSIGTVTASQNVTAPGIPENAWSHIAATWDGKFMKLYVDGRLRGEVNHTGDYIPARSDRERLRVGFAAAGVGSFKLMFDEVAIYNRALSADEILRHRYMIADQQP